MRAQIPAGGPLLSYLTFLLSASTLKKTRLLTEVDHIAQMRDKYE